MSFLNKLKGIFSSKSENGSKSTTTPPATNTPDKSPSSQYPPANIDWTKFQSAGPNDARSPCPMINALCNHSVLPHDGRHISKEMAVKALTQSINLDSHIASIFSSHAVNMNPDKTAHTFDLDHLNKHGDIEHDSSLSRNDEGFGDNHTFNPEIWSTVLSSYGEGATTTSFESVSKARFDRVLACKKAHDDAGLEFSYGIKEAILSYGESALLLGLLGSPEDGKIPIEYLKVLFQEARLPYTEGWRKSPRPITQKDMNHLIFSLIHANAQKADEAKLVEMDTVQAVQSAVSSIMPSFCSVM